MGKLILISDVSKMDTAIKSIKARGHKLDADIHLVALSAVAHFAKCGDVGVMNRLYLALPKGARHVAMTSWLTQFGGVMANTAEGKESTPFIKDKNKVVDMEGGEDTPWFECKPSASPDEVVDFYSLVMRVITKKTKQGQEVKNAALLARLAPILAQYKEEIDANADSDAVDETAEETTAEDPLAGAA